VGKDYGTTGTRSVTVALLGSSALPLDKGGRPSTVAPSHCFTYRKIRLPQANARIRRRIVQEELSFGLPFPLHECVWDFYLQAGSEAFAVVAQQARWQQLSSRWGLVQSVDPEPLCYLRAALQAGVGDALVIDFGASHTTWVALNSGKLEWVRTMMRGGQLLTQQIADESRIPLHEAEELKRRRGTEIPTVQAFLQDLLDEVLLAKPLPFRKVLLCGGGSGMPGLRAYLHSQFGVEPEPFPLPALLSHQEHVSAYGAALSGKFGQQRVHLSSKIATPSGGGSLNAWLSVLGLSLGLWGLATEVRYQGLIQKQNDVREQFRNSASQLGVVLPPTLKTPQQAEKWLIEQQQFRTRVRTRSVGFVADTLARAAQGLREVGDCQLYTLIFDDGKVTLEGDAGSHLKAQQLRQKWQQTFPDLRQINVQKSVGDRFRFHFESGMPKT